MKRKITFILCIWIALCSLAQTQQGLVKTIGRPGKPGTPLSNVTIRWRGEVNSVVSGADGSFSVIMTGKKNGDPIILQSVSKKGYELQDKSIIGRQQVFSSTVPIVITMVSNEQLQADKQRIEQNAYHKAELNYKKKLAQLQEQVLCRRYQRNLVTFQIYAQLDACYFHGITHVSAEDETQLRHRTGELHRGYLKDGSRPGDGHVAQHARHGESCSRN